LVNIVLPFFPLHAQSEFEQQVEQEQPQQQASSQQQNEHQQLPNQMSMNNLDIKTIMQNIRIFKLWILDYVSSLFGL